MTGENRKLVGMSVLLGAAAVLPMLVTIVISTSLVAWLLPGFFVALVLGQMVRSTGFRMLCWTVSAPLGAVASLMADVVMRRTGEAAGWTFLAFPYLLAGGVVVSGIGILLGIGARWISRAIEGKELSSRE